MEKSLLHSAKDSSIGSFRAMHNTNTQKDCPESYGLPMQKCSEPRCGGDVYYEGICDNILVSGAQGPGCPKGGCGKFEPKTQQFDQFWAVLGPSCNKIKIRRFEKT